MDSVEGHRYMMESFCKDCNLKLFYMNFIDKYGMLLEDYECTSSNFTDIYLRKSNYSPKQMPYSKLVNIMALGDSVNSLLVGSQHIRLNRVNSIRAEPKRSQDQCISLVQKHNNYFNQLKQTNEELKIFVEYKMKYENLSIEHEKNKTLY